MGDGFIAQITNNGANCSFVMMFGGTRDDRICEVEVAGNGIITIAGVTESPAKRFHQMSQYPEPKSMSVFQDAPSCE